MSTNDLAGEIRSARNAKNWSQLELSKNSKVSSRTIFQLENSKKIVKPDALVRLAFVLGKDPQAWLTFAGKKMSHEQIQAIISPLDRVQLMGQIDPLVFFGELNQKLVAKSMSVTMCAVYPCVPGALHRLDVQKYFIELLNTGKFRMAMVCPFHRVEKISSTKPHLTSFYRNVNDEVERLARELQNQVKQEYREQLAVFNPNSDKGDYLGLPTPGISEYRTALIEYKETGCSYELVNWVSLAQENKDRILRIYPAERREFEDSGLNTMLRWKDYFSDILKWFQPIESKGGKSAGTCMGPWRKVV